MNSNFEYFFFSNRFFFEYGSYFFFFNFMLGFSHFFSEANEPDRTDVETAVCLMIFVMVLNVDNYG